MVKEVHLLYIPFRYFLSGHVCFVFTLDNSRQIVISPEAATENFSPLLGFLPWYRLRYLKTPYGQYAQKYKKQNRPISLYRLSLSSEQAQKLFEDMDSKVLLLERKRVGYHILFNSCITNSCSHIQTFLQTSRCLRLSLLSPLQPKRIALRVNSKLELPYS